jgi:hypothetical protein
VPASATTPATNGGPFLSPRHPGRSTRPIPRQNLGRISSGKRTSLYLVGIGSRRIASQAKYSASTGGYSGGKSRSTFSLPLSIERKRLVNGRLPGAPLIQELLHGCCSLITLYVPRETIQEWIRLDNQASLLRSSLISGCRIWIPSLYLYIILARARVVVLLVLLLLVVSTARCVGSSYGSPPGGTTIDNGIKST